MDKIEKGFIDYFLERRNFKRNIIKLGFTSKILKNKKTKTIVEVNILLVC